MCKQLQKVICFVVTREQAVKPKWRSWTSKCRLVGFRFVKRWIRYYNNINFSTSLSFRVYKWKNLTFFFALNNSRNAFVFHIKWWNLQKRVGVLFLITFFYYVADTFRYDNEHNRPSEVWNRRKYCPLIFRIRGFYS